MRLYGKYLEICREDGTMAQAKVLFTFHIPETTYEYIALLVLVDEEEYEVHTYRCREEAGNTVLDPISDENESAAVVERCMELLEEYEEEDEDGEE